MIHGRQIPPAAGRTGATPDARVAPTQRPPSTADVDTQRLETPRVGVQRLSEHAVLPAYAHAGDAGLDLVASEPCMLATGERRAVPTGLALAIPVGWVGLVHPRSGLALRHGLTVANAPGTIDAGYRGEVRVILVNLGADPVEVCRGERIAQLVLQRVGRAELIEVDSLDDTDRGAGGFGSTGTS